MRLPFGLCWSSPKFADTNPVNPTVNENFRVLAIADVATKYRCAALPHHRHAGAPNRGELGGTRGRHIALVALAGLARLAAGQPGPTSHVFLGLCPPRPGIVSPCCVRRSNREPGSAGEGRQ